MMKINFSRKRWAGLLTRPLAAMDRLLQPVGVIGVVENKTQLKRRLKMLTSFNDTRSASIIGLALITMVGFTTFTSAQQTPKTDANTIASEVKDPYAGLDKPFDQMAKILELSGKELVRYRLIVAKAMKPVEQWEKQNIAKVLELRTESMKLHPVSGSKPNQKKWFVVKDELAKLSGKGAKLFDVAVAQVRNELSFDQLAYMKAIKLKGDMMSELEYVTLTKEQEKTIAEMIAPVAEGMIQQSFKKKSYLYEDSDRAAQWALHKKVCQEVLTDQQHLDRFNASCRKKINSLFEGVKLSDKQEARVKAVIDTEGRKALEAMRNRKSKGKYRRAVSQAYREILTAAQHKESMRLMVMGIFKISAELDDKKKAKLNTLIGQKLAGDMPYGAKCAATEVFNEFMKSFTPEQRNSQRTKMFMWGFTTYGGVKDLAAQQLEKIEAYVREICKTPKGMDRLTGEAEEKIKTFLTDEQQAGLNASDRMRYRRLWRY